MTTKTNEWSRSSFCADNACVEVKVEFTSASGCSGGNCVEVGRDGPVVLVRDSKNLDHAPLGFSLDDWSDFLDAIRSGTIR